MSPKALVPATADLLDEHGDRAAVCLLPLRNFGGRAAFAGVISTIRCFEDNVLLARRVSEPGDGRVLVVDAAGSLRVAVLGDRLAGLALAHGWAGVVINGAIRDSAALVELDLGIKALGTCPRRSAKEGHGELDVPVAFGEVTFEPGAMLYADDDGIAVLPRTDA